MSRQGSPYKNAVGKPTSYRLTVLGAGSVGKTAILKRFLDGEFIEKHKETVEDLYIRTFNVNGQFIQARIFDTAGTDVNQFPAMRRLSIGNAQAFLMVYDVISANSFRMLEGILKEIKEIHGENGTEQLPIVIAANKCDLPIDHWSVTGPMVNQFMLNETLDLRAVHMETSAKTGCNVQAIFETLIKLSPLFLDQGINSVRPAGSSVFSTSFDFDQSISSTGWRTVNQPGRVIRPGGSPVHQKKPDRAQRRLSLQMLSLNDHKRSNGIGASNYSMNSNATDGNAVRFDQNRYSERATGTGTTMKQSGTSDEIANIKKHDSAGSRRKKFFRRNRTKSQDEYEVPECIVQ